MTVVSLNVDYGSVAVAASDWAIVTSRSQCSGLR